MVFSSAVFLLYFLPIVVLGNMIMKNKLANIFLLICSLIFYAWGEPKRIFVMLLIIIICWYVSLCMKQNTEHSLFILAIGVGVVLIFLVYYKYANFFMDIVNKLFRVINLDVQFKKEEISLPIGISFYTFQAISYMIDCYRDNDRMDDCTNIIDVGLYISFFPQLIAGPIVKYKEISSQIKNRQMSKINFALGIRRFIYGLGKKVILANNIARISDSIFDGDINRVGGWLAWTAAIAYSLQIYYDFSGYSDMAIGLGKIFGFEYNENFDYPYMAKNVREFWNRWHISLGKWFKEYVYIPLGGNRKGINRTYINLIIVFFLTGLWHGANYTFILWGLYHGLWSLLERTKWKNFIERHSVFAHLYLTVIVILGWIMFRSDNIYNALQIYLRMFFPMRYIDDWTVLSINVREMVAYLTLGLLGVGIIPTYLSSLVEKYRYTWIELVWCIFIYALSFLSIASGTYNPFIYYQF